MPEKERKRKRLYDDIGDDDNIVSENGEEGTTGAVNSIVEEGEAPVPKKRRRTVIVNESSDDDDEFQEEKQEDETESSGDESDESDDGHGATASGGDDDDDDGDKHSDNGDDDDNVKFERMVNAKATRTAKTPAFAYEAFDPEETTVEYWKPGTPTPYMLLAQTMQDISQISSRIKITQLMTNCLRLILARSPDDLLPALYLSINKLAPDFEGVELGVGEGILVKAIAQATGKQTSRIKEMLNREGDLGTVAQKSRATQRTMFAPKPLTIRQVFRDFKYIATTSGTNSHAKKLEKIQSLLVGAKGCETQFIVRSLQGKLRIGLGEETVLASLAHAVLIHQHNRKRKENQAARPQKKPPKMKIPPPLELKQAEETLKMVYCELPVYDDIVKTLLQTCKDSDNPFLELHKYCHLTPGIPVRPMLSKAAKGYAEIFERFKDTRFICEYKYDGERAQIHMDKSGTVSIFSRNLENNTGKFPDIIADIPKALNHTENHKITSFIIDCEVVAFDRETKQIKPFQMLTTRGRKNIKIEDIRVPVCLFAFDLLYLNGKSYLRESLDERRKALLSAFKIVDDEFRFSSSVETNDMEKIQSFLSESVKNNCEGLMVKTLEKDGSTYEPSKRSYNWLKVKKDYLEGLGDTVDLVPIGGYLGKGKRTGVYGGFLLACYDPDMEEFQTVCKIGTGFSDEQLATFAKVLNEHRISAPKGYYNFGDSHKPDVWFDAVQVWEVLAADLTLSPVHRAAIGLVDDTRGIALRFPRFVRIRDDKQPEESTTAAQIAELFREQDSRKEKGEGEETHFD